MNRQTELAGCCHAAVFGCSLFFDSKTDDKTAQELVNDGMEAFNKPTLSLCNRVVRQTQRLVSVQQIRHSGWNLKIADAHFYNSRSSQPEG